MEAICSSETSADTERTTRRYISEDGTLHMNYYLTNQGWPSLAKCRDNYLKQALSFSSTNSTKQTPSPEAVKGSPNKFPQLLWNPEILYIVSKGLHLTLSCTRRHDSPTQILSSVLILSRIPQLSSSKWSLTLRFSEKRLERIFVLSPRTPSAS
jgi:hypothetical protein